MMRRRTAVGLLAGVLLAGLIAVPGAPAGAQDIADLPRLGYEITPDRGHVGDEVHSQVNVDDLREHCWSTALIDDSPGADVQTALDSYMMAWLMYWSPGEWLQTMESIAMFNPLYGPLHEAAIERWGFFAPNENPGKEIIQAVRTGPVPAGIPDNQDGAFFMNNIGSMLNTLSGVFGVALVEELYPAVHVTTFVDPVTQEMVGEMGTFDPETGEGTMLVPELDPGLYAVAAACAFMVPYDQMHQALTNGFVAAWDWSVENDMFPTGTGPDAWPDWAEAGGLAAILAEIVAPVAVGIDFYCILQPDGYCATPPGPVGLIDDDVLDEFNGDDPLAPGPGGEGPEDLDGTGDLVAVQATPSFTG